MAGGKETPRQKMIGMMYLVLTAMLALNVSATVLDAFVLVENGLTQTTKNISIKNERLHNQMESAYAINPTKVESWKNTTDEIRQKTRELVDYIQELKILTVTTAEDEESLALIGENEVDASLISSKGDTNVSGRIFIGGDGTKGKATELKEKMIDYREYMTSVIDPVAGEQLISSINSILNTDNPPPSADGTPHTWESTRFDHIPLVALFPQLTKIQLDMLNVEAEVVSYMLQQVDAGDFKVNKLDAVVIAKSNYVFQGNEFAAEIFLAASDTTQTPKIYIGNYETYLNDQGVADYKMVGSYEEIPIVNGRGIFTRNSRRIGMNKWSGLLEVTGPDGSKFRRPFNHEFEVAEPNVVVSPTKMNVFYRGVENPVNISIPGVSGDKIKPTVDGGGSIRRIKGGYEVIPGRGKECNVNVFAEIDGKRRNMGIRKFRVRDVPDPIPSVRGVKSRIVSKNELAASLSVEARMPESFDFDLSFRVTEFKVMATVGGFTQTQPSENQMITDQQRRLLDNLRSGQTVNFVDIKAVGPDGKVRPLNDIVYRIR